ncbi:hypothetical protein Amsp01_089610 [Amycolatopsis sp. NBRC 101858]|uniref:hypothetical protein n=1 Tax=Amycolatopsis sp. NBRC 101858 TaxID=3032200 RepID=UPI0024A095DE|nr:hypothetical protein [Amycolatopsis sp. NBRC 101858]GLY42938.1 hypothetical protein Amsp01_089610 [Amycolatopsis sp. NBRC 101858]
MDEASVEDAKERRREPVAAANSQSRVRCGDSRLAVPALRHPPDPAHEATALWDVKTAADSGREVKPIEQRIHSFLESLPFMGTAAIACLHWKDVRAAANRAQPA